MKIAVFGQNLFAGVIAALLAESGHQIFWCQLSSSIDIRYDDAVIKLLHQQEQLGFLQSCSLDALPLDLDSYFFCFSATEEQMALELARTLQKRPIIHPKVMLNASTFGLNGTAKLQQILHEDHWAYVPDMLQEGKALASFIQLEQLIVGVENPHIQPFIQEIFRPFFPRPQQFLFMPILDAEFTKLSISGMLATRISYMNDLAVVAEKLGIDIEHVRQGLSADQRIGGAYLNAGAGFGGESFSHDILTLTQAVSKTGIKSELLSQVWEINEQQKEILFRKLWNYYQGNLVGKTVAIWGASFKENTARVEQSPIHVMLSALWAQGVTVKLHDPQALIEIQKIYGQRDDLIYCQHAYDATVDADALCILTAWKQYLSPNYQKLHQDMRHPLLLDGRNIYDPSFVKAQGFAYRGIGR